jgi:hypothetical protein
LHAGFVGMLHCSEGPHRVCAMRSEWGRRSNC